VKKVDAAIDEWIKDMDGVVAQPGLICNYLGIGRAKFNVQPEFIAAGTALVLAAPFCGFPTTSGSLPKLTATRRA